MSEAKDMSNVLLPAARIDIFAFSDDTQKLFEALKEDWRFARVILDVKKASVDEAISKYKEYSSPDLVILGTDDISDDFISKLGDLAIHCEEGTEAVIIGPENDVQLYRRLVGMGVRDYLVRPVAPEDVVSVVGKALFDKMGISESRVITVIGSKGGVGTTSVAQNIAWTVAEKLGLKTILMDAGGGWSTLNVALGAEPTAGLAECMKTAAEGTDEDLERMYAHVSDNLTLFACGGDDLMKYHAEGDMYEKAINRIMKTYPVVIIDLSQAPADVRYRMIDRAHEVIAVTTPALTSLRLARTVLADIKARRGKDKVNINLILNKKGMFGKKEITDKDIQAALDHMPQASISYDADLFNESESSGKPAVTLKGGETMLETLEKMAVGISGYKGELSLKHEDKSGGLMDKILSGLKKKE